MIISSKAGHDMWPGVYGGNSSRKNLIASCDASLKRTGLEYFDVFYSHRYDGVTPIEETMQALIDIVRSGKALYAGISKYPPREQKYAYRLLAEAKVPCLVSQYRYSCSTRLQRREFRVSRCQRKRHHGLFSIGARSADRPLSSWHPRRKPCCQKHRVPPDVAGHRRQDSQGPPIKRTRRPSRTDSGPDGIGLDTY